MCPYTHDGLGSDMGCSYVSSQNYGPCSLGSVDCSDKEDGAAHDYHVELLPG